MSLKLFYRFDNIFILIVLLRSKLQCNLRLWSLICLSSCELLSKLGRELFLRPSFSYRRFLFLLAP